ncbi:MAG TPA: hypothetical protein VHV47_04645 [Opitutaceae bacterium]|jgi:hypothetical protein|nr:hypothetical protein [Opitutaceae bacterium]
MTRAKKTLLWFAGAALAVLLAVYLVASFGMGSIVRREVDRRGPQLTQTPVSLSLAEISPFDGTGTLTDLTVGNPKGWSAPDAFKLKKIHVNLEPCSLLSHEIVINEIMIEEPELTYETKFVASNIGDLIKNIKKTTDRSAKAPADQSAPGKTFIIRKLRLEKGHLKFGVGPTAVTLEMPAVEFDNLGSAGKGITADQLSIYVMRIITTSVVKTTTGTLGKGVGGLTDAAGLLLKGSFDVLKAIIP